MKRHRPAGHNGSVGDFGVDTQVEGDDGAYRATLSEDWRIWGPNGGYVAAIALRAAGAATHLPRPASFAGHFLSVADFGVVDLEVVPLRESKRAASLRVSMRQGDRRILEAIVWATDRVPGLDYVDISMPDVPQPEALQPVTDFLPPEVFENRYSFWNNFEERWTVPWVPWAEREAGPAVCHEWLRFQPKATFPGDPFLDAARSLLVIDTMGWPAACQTQSGDMEYIAPSLDVAVRFHDEAPDEPWLLCEAMAPIAKTGLVGTDVRTWAPDGRLLASGGSQLFCRPAPQA